MISDLFMLRWAWITWYRRAKDRLSMRWHGTRRCTLCGSVVTRGETCCRFS